MKMNLLIVGGFYHIGFAIFHLFFWQLFNWKKDLASLSIINRAVMQILNLCLTFVFIVVAYISIYYSSDLVSTSLGRIIIGSISMFWLVRIGEQLFFFGLKKRVSIILTIIFIIGFIIYLIPVLNYI